MGGFPLDRFCRAAIDKKLGAAVMTMLTFFKLKYLLTTLL